MALYASRDFEEVHMEWLIATYALAAMVAIFVVGVMLLVYRLIHGICGYFRFWEDQAGDLPRDARGGGG
jgi:hypothetical protein